MKGRTCSFGHEEEGGNPLTESEDEKQICKEVLGHREATPS